MRCPYCAGATEVMNTRSPKRRRQCHKCGKRFSTVEILASDDKAQHSLIASVLVRLRVMKPALADLLEDLEKLP